MPVSDNIPLVCLSEYSGDRGFISIRDYVDDCVKLGHQYAGLCDTNLYAVPEFLSRCRQDKIIPIIGLTVDYETLDGVVLPVHVFAKTLEGYRYLSRLVNDARTLQCSVQKHEQGDMTLWDRRLKFLKPKDCFAVINSIHTQNVPDLLSAVQEIESIGINVFVNSHSASEELINKYQFSSGKQNTMVSPIVLFRHRDDFQAFLHRKFIINEWSKSRPVRFYELEDMNLQNNIPFRIPDKLKAIIQEIEPYSISWQQHEFDEAEYVDSILPRISMGMVRHGITPTLDIANRITDELKMFSNISLFPYIHEVDCITQSLRKNKVFFCSGRGSAGASLVLFLLGITQINPLQYDLKFARFANLSRRNKMELI